MLSRFIIQALPPRRALIATIGFADESADIVKRLFSRQSTVIDLDELDLTEPLPATASEPVAVVARSITDLRRAVSLSSLMPTAHRVVIAVAESPPDRLPSLPSLPPDLSMIQTLAVTRGPKSEWIVDARCSSGASSGQLLSIVVRGLQRQRPHPIQRVALTGRGAAAWRPGDPDAIATTMHGPLDDLAKIPPADVVFRALATGQPPEWCDPRVKVIDRPCFTTTTWSSLGRAGGIAEWTRHSPSALSIDAVPPVDEYSINPMGFDMAPSAGVAELAQKGDRWVIQGDGLAPITVRTSGLVTDAEIARLRPMRAINIKWGRHTGPIAAVHTVACLAMAGVPLTASDIPAWAGPLGPELTRLIAVVRAPDLSDDLSREVHSIRLRRAAMRSHSTRARWRNLASSVGLSLPPSPTVSVVMCTMRPDFVSSALAQISRQQDVELEVILTLHGLPLDQPEIKSAIDSFDRPLTVVSAPGTVALGEALNYGASAASGYYIAKWDDDDWYGPHHLADLVNAATYSGAELVGCAHQMTYLEQIDLTVYHPKGGTERFNKHVAGSTLLIDRQVFNDIGRFRPVTRGEDSSLLRAVVAAGGRYYRTHGLGYLVNRRATGHTWSVPVTHFMRNMTRQWRGIRHGELFESNQGCFTEKDDGQ